MHFFASWCAPCAGEAPVFGSLRLASGARIVAVDVSDDHGAALRFVRRFGWRMPVLVDARGVTGRAYGILGLPTTFILDPRGRVAAELAGPQTAATVQRSVAEVEARRQKT